jgi:hypothetical protein
LFDLWGPANVGPFFCRAYNPNKGGNYLTQRRKGLDKAGKENHLKKRRQTPFAALRLAFAVLA